jgi:hypothetical protein
MRRNLDLRDAAGSERGGIERALRMHAHVVDAAHVDGQADGRHDRDDQHGEHHGDVAGAITPEAAYVAKP